MAHRVLIVEDNRDLVRFLRDALSRWGLESQGCDDFTDVTGAVASYQPHIILMDISLPYYNGHYWTQEIRKTQSVPIIFLSSQDDTNAMIMAMTFGADDYVTKPFESELLVTKIKALLRREYQFAAPDPVLRFQKFDLQLSSNQVVNGNESVSCSRNDMKLLQLLFQHPHQIITREQMIEKLWDDDQFIDRNALSVTMTRLRQKLHPIGFDSYLVTVRGKGYQLTDAKGN